MKLQDRVEILSRLGAYIAAQPPTWQQAVHQSYQQNNWFVPEFVQTAATSIAEAFLDTEKLQQWVAHYHLNDSVQPKNVGVVMAGNIPMVGFHDFLCAFICGHTAVLKPSSKDNVLLQHLVAQMIGWNPAVAGRVQFADMLKNCDAYIATGSDNSARYFNYYFGRYPSIIRKNRTSVAILTGNETENELSLLADDIMRYFGLGCRNVTQLYVPAGYDFVPLLNALRKYQWMFEHHKYRSNYDYQLAIYIMNNKFYMTNDCVVLVEQESPFSPIGSLHYQYYSDADSLYGQLAADEQIQAVVGNKGIAFGKAQQPSLFDYADGVDVMAFLLGM